MHYCDYGCGKEAKYLLKCGKWCCNTSPNSCDVMRKKNRDGLDARRRSGKKKKSSYGMRGKTPWNKGLTASSDSRVAAQVRKAAVSLKGRPSHKQSKETRAKISATMRTRHLGGLRKGAGRGKKGYYNGIWCDSSWELAYVMHNIDHGVEFKRNTKSFAYTYNGATHKYYPDFILSDGSYVEIKGYYTPQTVYKLEQFSKQHVLIVIDKNKIGKYIQYAVSIYGDEFYNLYDKT